MSFIHFIAAFGKPDSEYTLQCAKYIIYLALKPIGCKFSSIQGDYIFQLPVHKALLYQQAALF